MTKKDICDRIKSIREQQRITQENIAYSMGISTSEYYKLESGKYNFNISQIVLLSKILNVNVISFFIEPNVFSTIGNNIAAEPKLKYNKKQ
ncbi:MAG: helix-turn-helix domain-containing protein [Paludibacteraceae bacterium]|nr:helix-turn-helix domain-containing protein [Paludibacteraceae bacterium]